MTRRTPHVLIPLAAAAAVVIAAPLARDAAQDAELSPSGPAVAESLPAVGAGEESPPATLRSGQGPATTDVDGGRHGAAGEPQTGPRVPVETPAPSTPSNSIAHGPLPVDVSDRLACIRAVESDSSGGYRAVSPDGRYSGAYQFDRATWASVGGTGDPAEASPAEQDARAAELLERRGTQPWPPARHC